MKTVMEVPDHLRTPLLFFLFWGHLDSRGIFKMHVAKRIELTLHISLGKVVFFSKK